LAVAAPSRRWHGSCGERDEDLASIPETRLMNTFLRAPLCAVASLFLFTALPAGAQGDGNAAASPGASDSSGSADRGVQAAPDTGSADDSAGARGSSRSSLPGVVLERNIFVPVDHSGHPTSNQYIVVERRMLAPRDGDADSQSPAGSAGAPDAPTNFILVPQESDDDSDAAPQQ
jgi:hypothetical protein